MINREETPRIADQYQSFRKIILELTPDAEGIRPSNELPNVWGALIEESSRIPPLSIAVMTLADEHTSIYASEGAAYLHINAFPEIVEVSKHILTLAENLLSLTKPTTEFPIAKIGTVNFFIFTYAGAVMANIEVKELSTREHPFVPLYAAYHEILYRNRVLIKNTTTVSEFGGTLGQTSASRKAKAERKQFAGRWIGVILTSLVYGPLIGVVVGYLFGNQFLGFLGGVVIGLLMFAKFWSNEKSNR
jgi:hypothetical protein